MGCYIWYSEDGPGRTAAPLSPLLAVPNVTAHLSTASVPIVFLYNAPLLCGFNVPIKGLSVDRNVDASFFISGKTKSIHTDTYNEFPAGWLAIAAQYSSFSY